MTSAQHHNLPPTIFISYGRADTQELANRLSRDLADAGYDIWQDTKNIRASHAWHHEIEDGLRSSQIVIALLSPHAVRTQRESPNATGGDSVCLDEISFAQFELRRPIVPVMGKKCSPPLFIHRLDYVDLSAWQESASQYEVGLKRLLDALSDARQGKVRYRRWADDLPKMDFSPFIHLKRRNFIGRKWLFEKLDTWRSRPGEPSLLIKGDPGVGKSAFASQLVHLNPEGQVLAYHFCRADTPDTLNPARFVRSIAGMIASQLEGFAECLDEHEIKQALDENRCEQDPASAFERGILAPLHRFPAPEEGSRYLLIDALDESLFALDTVTVQGRRGMTIIDLLADRLDQFPRWFRVVATTRKERDVIERLGRLRAEEIDAESDENLHDLTEFVEQRLNSPKLATLLAGSACTRNLVIKLLDQKSQGNFLFVQQALLAIEDGTQRFEDLESFPSDLYGQYLRYFERQFPNENSYQPIKQLLQFVLAAREPLTGAQLVSISGMDPESEFPVALRRLSSYVPAREVPNNPTTYSFFHKSFADWLSSNHLRGTMYYISTKKAHERFAEYCAFQHESGNAEAYCRKHRIFHAFKAERLDLIKDASCAEAVQAVIEAYFPTDRAAEKAQEVIAVYKTILYNQQRCSAFEQINTPLQDKQLQSLPSTLWSLFRSFYLGMFCRKPPVE